MEALLLSNSTNFGQTYMQWCHQTIAAFMGQDKKEILFVPYAAVNFSYEQYTDTVNQALQAHGIEVVNIDTVENQHEALERCSGIFVGGGNTFHLLKQLQDKNLIPAIQTAVNRGAKYVGWSAGSNVAGASIKTTNDMPIVEPQSFNAIGLIDFVINPHFTDKTIEGHGGESRSQRLEEFIAANPQMPVMCLPEASYLELGEKGITYHGNHTGLWMSELGVKEVQTGEKVG